ncbi:thiamine pyrophosphate-dependent dehydrogenase E1 component subunit alpha [candidate division KSB1 bacterium]|nr:thiamine pyrophosphate-dependent dehydrogenase E1 component subunit alpha [candidate division KSB1 bacterium]
MYSKDLLKELYRTLFRIRTFETECIKLYRQGLIRGYFHPYLGEEAVAGGVCLALGPKDYIISTHRGHGHCIARGASLDRMVAELFAKETGYCGGLGGSMHIADVSTGNLGANGIVGGGIPIGVGAALGISLRAETGVVAIFFSDGAANNGVFGESLNLAAIWNLPVIFVLENNHYAVSTPIEQSSRNPDLYKRAEGYGVFSSAVDGNDALAIYEKTREAAELCRQGKGPVLIEAKTYRHGGHHVNDPGQYMPAERLEYYKAKDPLLISRKYITESELVSSSELDTIEIEVAREMENAIEFAKQSAEPALDSFLELIKEY